MDLISATFILGLLVGYLIGRAATPSDVAAEREACAKACQSVTESHTSVYSDCAEYGTDDWLSEKCARAIRARK